MTVIGAFLLLEGFPLAFSETVAERKKAKKKIVVFDWVFGFFFLCTLSPCDGYRRVERKGELLLEGEGKKWVENSPEMF